MPCTNSDKYSLYATVMITMIHNDMMNIKQGLENRFVLERGVFFLYSFFSFHAVSFRLD